MIKAILFDKDGTVLDFDATWIPAIAHLVDVVSGEDADLARALGLAGGYDKEDGTIVSGSLFASGNAATLAARWHPLLTAHASARPNAHSKVRAKARAKACPTCPACEELAQTIDHIFTTQSARHITPLFDVAALFERLKQSRLALGIASSDSQQGVEASLKALQIAGLTDFICGYDSGFGRKPEPGMVHGFCAALGVTAAQTLVIGDNIHDLEMGQRAGAGLLVGVLSGNSTAEDLAPLADEILATAEELPLLLSRLNLI